MKGILQFTSTNHVILPFFTDIKIIIYTYALLCLQINIHKTIEEKTMVINQLNIPRLEINTV